MELTENTNRYFVSYAEHSEGNFYCLKTMEIRINDSGCSDGLIAQMLQSEIKKAIYGTASIAIINFWKI